MLDGSGLKKLVDISQRHLGVLYVTCGKKRKSLDGSGKCDKSQGSRSVFEIVK